MFRTLFACSCVLFGVCVDASSKLKLCTNDKTLPHASAFIAPIVRNGTVHLFGSAFMDLNITYADFNNHANLSQLCSSNPTQHINSHWKTLSTLNRGFQSYERAVLTKNDTVYMFAINLYTSPYSIGFGNIWKYNLKTEILTEFAKSELKIPNGAQDMCATYDERTNLVYLLGGYTNNSYFISASEFLQVFNVSDETFIRIADSEFKQPSDFDITKGRTWGTCGINDNTGKLYYFGGYHSSVSQLNSILEYNTQTHVWIEHNSIMKDTRVFASSIFDGVNKFYYFGGYFYTSVESFNSDTNTTKREFYLNKPAAGIGSAVVTLDRYGTGKLEKYVILAGGWWQDTNGNNEFYDSFEIYSINYDSDDDDDEYSNKLVVEDIAINDDLVLPQNGIVSMIYRPFDESLYLFGGTNWTHYYNTVFKYSLHSMFGFNLSESLKTFELEWELVDKFALSPFVMSTNNYAYMTELDTLYMFGPSGLDFGEIMKYTFDADYQSVNKKQESTTSSFYYYRQDVTIPNRVTGPCVAKKEKEGVVYVLGGFVEDSDYVNEIKAIDNTNFFHVFNATNESFINVNNNDNPFKQLSDSSGNSMIDSRVFGSCIYSELLNAIYYLGGIASDDYNNDAYAPDKLNSVLMYNLSSHEWYEMENVLVPTEGITNAFVLNISDKFWLFGAQSEVMLSEIIVYDPVLHKSYFASDYNENLILNERRTIVTGTIVYSYNDNDTYGRYDDDYGADFLDPYIVIGGGYGYANLSSFWYNTDIEVDVNDYIFFDTVYASSNVAQIKTPAPTNSIQDILEEWIECEEIQFPFGIQQNILVYVNDTAYMRDLHDPNIMYTTTYMNKYIDNKTQINTGFDYYGKLCSIGGIFDGDVQKSIYCYNITNITCDENINTDDLIDNNNEWYKMEEELPFAMRMGNSQYALIEEHNINNNYSHAVLYIFGPGQDHDDLNMQLTGAIVKYDFIEGEIEMLDSMIPGNATDPCVCYDETRQLIYVMGSYTYDNAYIVLYVFEIKSQRILSQSEAFDLYGIVTKLPDYIKHPSRQYGNCHYNREQELIYYFNGIDWSVWHWEIINSILVYDLANHVWYEVDDVFIQPRVTNSMAFMNGLYYFIAGEIYPNKTYDYEPSYISSVEVYNPLSNETYINDDAELDAKVNYMSIAVINAVDTIILVGGYILEKDKLLSSAKICQTFDFGTSKDLIITIIPNITAEETPPSVDDLLTQVFRMEYFELVAGILIGTVMLLMVLVQLDNMNKLWIIPEIKIRKRIQDDADARQIFTFAAQLWDFFTDINMLFYLISMYVNYPQFDEYMILSIICGIFIIVPWFCNSYLACLKMRSIVRKRAPFNKPARMWLDTRGAWLATLTVISGNLFSAIGLVNSKIFGITMFSMGLSDSEKRRFLGYKIVYSIFLENIPQVLISIGVIMINNYIGSKYDDRIRVIEAAPLLSLIGSILSILVTMSQHCSYSSFETIEFNFEIEITMKPTPIGKKIHATKLSQNPNTQTPSLALAWDKNMKLYQDARKTFGKKLGGLLAVPKNSRNVVQIREIRCDNDKEMTCNIDGLISIGFDSKKFDLANGGTLTGQRQLQPLQEKETYFNVWKCSWPNYAKKRLQPFDKNKIYRNQEMTQMVEYYNKMIHFISRKNAKGIGELVEKFFGDKSKLNSAQKSRSVDQQHYELHECNLKLLVFVK